MRDGLQIVLREAQELPTDQLPALIGGFVTVLMERLMAVPVQSEQPDALLDVVEAAGRLRVSKDYLYRHKEFPFRRREGRKLLFSAAGIDKHIRQTNVLMSSRHGSKLSSVAHRTA